MLLNNRFVWLTIIKTLCNIRVLGNAVKLPPDIAIILTRQLSITLNITGPSVLENLMKCKAVQKKHAQKLILNKASKIS